MIMMRVLSLFILFVLLCFSVQLMSQMQEEAANKQVQRKNQKNIYVHKIKSLMRNTPDTILQDQSTINQALNKNKIKKVTSELDKNAVKLEKNRESAKRARLRKKLYIKLLENRVEKLKEGAAEGERIEREADKFLRVITKREGKQDRDGEVDEVERYLSRDNVASYKKAEQEQREELCARMDKIVEQICQVTCSSLRNIRELSSQVSLDQILKPQLVNVSNHGDQLQQTIKEVLVEAEQLRNIYLDLMRENENVKRAINDHRIYNESPMLHLSGESSEQRPDNSRNSLMSASEFCSYYKRPNESSNVFINLTEAQKILVQSWCFLQQNTNQDEQL